MRTPGFSDTNEPADDTEKAKYHLYGMILREVGEKIYSSPRTQPAKSKNNMPFGWSTDSSEERNGESLYHFFLYAEARPKEAAEPDAQVPPPIAEFALPAADLPDGTPTRKVFFLDRSKAIEVHHQKAILDGEQFGDWQEIDRTPDLDLEDREALLRELCELGPIV